jgi:hypothetical protein
MSGIGWAITGVIFPVLWLVGAILPARHRR